MKNYIFYFINKKCVYKFLLYIFIILIVRYFEDKFEENIIPSRTTSYFKKIINNDGKKYNFDIFDTPGAQNLRALTKVFMKDVKIIVLVYDIGYFNIK